METTEELQTGGHKVCVYKKKKKVSLMLLGDKAGFYDFASK